jgi:hypothetical protein
MFHGGILGQVSRFADSMKYRARTILLLALAAAAAAVPVSGETVRNDFDSDALMRPPGFFDFVVLGSAPAKWLVLTDPNPPSVPYRLVQVEAKRPDDAIAIAVRRNYAFEDGSVTTYVKRGGSQAGMVLRMAGEKDLLALLVDTRTGEARLLSFRGGQATELGRAKAVFDREWEKLGVVASGPSLKVLFDERPLFEATDPKPVAGKAGLAAAGPGDASFDVFVLEFNSPKP